MEIKNLKDTTIRIKEGKKEKEYKLKCKFFSEEMKKEYWIYSDEVEDKNGDIELKVSSVVKKGDEVSLVSCTDESELKLVVNLYEALKRRVKVNKE